MSKETILYNGIEARLIYNAKLKNTYIRVSSNSEVTIKSPFKSQTFLLDLLQKREGWIRKQLEKISNLATLDVNLEDEVLLFGEIYSIDAPVALSLRKKLERLRVSSRENILKAYDTFYKELSHEYLTSRVEFFSKRMHLAYSDIKYRKMKSRWGSCNSKRVITLNSELLKVDKELIDYVVVHELAHLVHMNHSKEFHSLVESYLPLSKELRRRLKDIRLLH